MAAIDEHRKLNRAGAAEVHQRIHRRARGPAFVDDVVDEHDHLAVDVGHVRLAAMGGDAEMAIISMLADVERAHCDRCALELHEAVREPACEMVALRHHAHHDQVARAAVAFEDLVRDARERAPDLVGVHHRGLQPALLYRAHPNNLSRSAMRIHSPFRACRK